MSASASAGLVLLHRLHTPLPFFSTSSTAQQNHLDDICQTQYMRVQAVVAYRKEATYTLPVEEQG